MTSAPSMPRPVFCIIEHAHRRRAVADELLNGDFRIQGRVLRLGLEPDWLHDHVPEDEEWRVEWSKFYYGLDLAWAYRETGNAQYLSAWERLVRSWMRQVPVTRDPSDVIARRIQNWVHAWAAFATAPAFDGLKILDTAELLANIEAQSRHVRRHLSAERNHRTLELYALFIVALALPSIGEADNLAFAIKELHRNLLTDVGPDGVHREGSTHYHHVALRSFVGARENARRFGLTFPDGYDEHLARACEFSAHVHRPDGAIPALSDADTGSYLDVLELAASLLDRPDWRYIATRGRSGTVPARRHASFEWFGYYVQRSGWGEAGTAFSDERFLVFDCGRLGDGGHGHYDALNVEIAAGGAPLVVDPGRYTYSDVDGWRRWFKGTAAHNTVTIDGHDQVPYRRGKPARPLCARFLGRLTGPGLDVLSGEAASSCYPVIHRRRVIFVADEYWIVQDQLRAEGVHHYDLRFHLAPSPADIHFDLQRGDAFAPAVRAEGVVLLAAARADVFLERGWVAPTYGVKTPAPTVRYSADGSNIEFLTIVLPMASATRLPTLSVDHTDGVTTVALSGIGPDLCATDVVAWTPSRATDDLAGVDGLARIAWRRLVAGQVVVSGQATPDVAEGCGT